ncbi:MAG TPA: aspartate aminotransferase family protein [Armatimonadota bacterium]|jgi:predicted acetylornithine/succinylornithine family transaminase
MTTDRLPPVPEHVDADQVLSWNRQYIMQTYGRLPVVLERGEGVRVWDARGMRYLDLVSGGRAGNALGHGNKAVAEALYQQALRGAFFSNDYYHYPQAALAKKLAETTRCQRAFFVNSGAEASETAIKLARKWAKKKHGANRTEILTAEMSFHGRTLAAITATGQAKFQQGFEPLPAGFRYVPLNNVAALEAAISPQTCAIFMEPVQGESGIRPASQEYLKAVRRLCDEHGLLMILDEVQTGNGRSGRFWAYEHYGIEPDVLTTAKTLGGGAPIGVCLATEDAATGFGPGDHGCTFGGNPLSCAAALAALDYIEEHKLVEHAAEMGEYFQSRLRKMGETTGLISEVRGLGLLIGVDLTQPMAMDVVQRGCQEGLLIHASSDKTLRLLPPMIIQREEVDEALSLLECLLLRKPR